VSEVLLKIMVLGDSQFVQEEMLPIVEATRHSARALSLAFLFFIFSLSLFLKGNCQGERNE
jgi:hypothetical protein